MNDASIQRGRPWTLKLQKAAGVVVLCVVSLFAVSAFALVDMKNGNYSNEWVDLLSPRKDGSLVEGRGSIFDLRVSRSYNSRSLYDGIFGFGWCSDFETIVRPTAEGNVIVEWCGAGKIETFQRADSSPEEVSAMAVKIANSLKAIQEKDSTSVSSLIGGFVPNAWNALKTKLIEDEELRTLWALRLGVATPVLPGTVLKRFGSGSATVSVVMDGYVFVPGDGKQYRFDKNGQLQEARDASSISLRFTRGNGHIERVESSDGRALVFTFYSDGKVKKIEGPGGIAVDYRYQDGNLTGVRNAWLNVYRFEYDDLHNLTKAIWPDKTYIELRYDREHDLVAGFRDREGCLEDYLYETGDPYHYMTFVLKTCADGRVIARNSYEFRHTKRPDGDYALTYVRAKSDWEMRTSDTAIYYDLDGRPVKTIRNADIATFSYDDRGLLAKRSMGNKEWVFQYPPDASVPDMVIENTLDDQRTVVGSRRFYYDPWPAPYGTTEPIPASASSRMPDPLSPVFQQQRASDRLSEAAQTLARWDEQLARGKDHSGRTALAALAMTLGADCARQQNLQCALTSFDRAISIASANHLTETHYHALEWKARVYMKSALPADAIMPLRQAIDLIDGTKARGSTDEIQLVRYLIEAYKVAEQYSKAYETLGRLSALGFTDEQYEDLKAEIYTDVGLYQLALTSYRASLSLLLVAIDRRRFDTEELIASVADVFYQMGDPDKAIAVLDSELAIHMASERPSNGSGSLMSSKALYLTQARRYSEALKVIGEAIDALQKEHASDMRLGDAFNNQGILFSWLGNEDRAAQIYRQAIVLQSRNTTGRLAAASTMANLAVSYRGLGRYRDAVDLLNQSLTIRRSSFPSGHWLIGKTLCEIGETYRQSGDLQLAHRNLAQGSANLQEALGFSNSRFALCLDSLGKTELAEGNFASARADIRNALQVAIRTGDPESVWAAERSMSQLLQHEKRPDLAIFFSKEAIGNIQRLRSNLSRADPAIQRSFLHSKEDVYREAADLLIDEGRLLEAQDVLSMLKQEEYFDFLRRTGPYAASQARAATPQEKTWEARYREINAQLARLGEEESAFRLKAKLGTLSGDEMKRRIAVQADLDVANRAFEAFIGELERQQYLAVRSSATVSQSSDARGFRSFEVTLQKLGHGAVVIAYVVAADRVSIMLTTPNVQIARTTRISSRRLNQQVARFRMAVQDPRSDPRPYAKLLYDELIGPIADYLRDAKADTLMLSLDGTLRYVPFSALYDGQKYLVERFKTVIYAGATKDKLHDSPQQRWRVSGLGVTETLSGFKRLPGVREELTGIVRQGNTGLLPGVLYFDKDFTDKNLRDALDRQYPVVHIASHFVFTPGTEDDSFLLLGDGTRLSLSRLRSVAYNFGNVDLLTLSACQTAIGEGRDANGKEIEGFAVLAQESGAKAVLATLWSVDDESTAFVMQDFYRIRQATPGITKAAALQRAQTETMSATSSKIAENRGGTLQRAKAPADSVPFKHPYYWAPFILMGNWL
ncbi:CHAT domain-containing protein [Paraburkholderia dilworthii]|uniref:CHAT domain-containing protein n=1 Tax=Paraburkholderia dilworthii TaxID=948106 RepID=UPI0004881830|nr:CHAT domain-containing protein [Paraburkholderia dilworthii]